MSSAVVASVVACGGVEAGNVGRSAPTTAPTVTGEQAEGATSGSTVDVSVVPEGIDAVVSGSSVPGTSVVATTTTTPPPTTEPATGAVRIASGLLLPLRARMLDGTGWVVGTPCGNETLLLAPTPVTGVRVVLDPGHGGAESGTVAGNGLWESTLNLDVAQRIERVLEAQGITVELTRRTDMQVTLPARAELVRALAPALAVSVHHNGGQIRPNPEPGTIVFHQVDAPQSRRLAGLVHEEVENALRPLELPWVAGATPGARAVRNLDGDDYYGILRGTADVPTVIVEAMYLTNPTEAQALQRDEVRQLEAVAIATAIVRHLTTTASGSGFTSEMVFGPGSVPRNEPATCVDPPIA